MHEFFLRDEEVKQIIRRGVAGQCGKRIGSARAASDGSVNEPRVGRGAAGTWTGPGGERTRRPVTTFKVNLDGALLSGRPLSVRAPPCIQHFLPRAGVWGPFLRRRRRHEDETLDPARLRSVVFDYS